MACYFYAAKLAETQSSHRKATLFCSLAETARGQRRAAAAAAANGIGARLLPWRQIGPAGRAVVGWLSVLEKQSDFCEIRKLYSCSACRLAGASVSVSVLGSVSQAAKHVEGSVIGCSLDPTKASPVWLGSSGAMPCDVATDGSSSDRGERSSGWLRSTCSQFYDIKRARNFTTRRVAPLGRALNSNANNKTQRAGHRKHRPAAGPEPDRFGPSRRPKLANRRPRGDDRCG